jgi:hypothetical protein
VALTRHDLVKPTVGNNQMLAPGFRWVKISLDLPTERRRPLYARVATLEGDPQPLVETIESEAGSGPPEGVPSKELLVLVDRTKGKTLAITLFDSEDDMRKGDQALGKMTPPDGVTRSSVGMYEVAIHLKA